MTFTTPTFLVFFLLVYALYWRMRRDGQNRLILLSSLVFYGWWDWRFLLLLLFSAGIDFLAAMALERPQSSRGRLVWLLVSLVSNLGLLCFFKYFGFFAASLADLLTAFGFQVHGITLQVVLPVGISFYTFQALSYTIDVYRGRIPAVRDLVQYFSFITFFPHMVAGPIQQAKHFLVQFDRSREFDWSRSVDGARQMLWGFFKKMVVADNLAPLVDAAYNDPSGVGGLQLLLATYFFAFQIYCDFSGYTDIAIGCARTLDLHMTTNFSYPYFAQSIPEFWRRWHITLSTWFREYLYIPLGGNRCGLARRRLNVFIVFMVSGLWHGANWTFLIWGALHGMYYLLDEVLTGGTAPAPVGRSGRASLQGALRAWARMVLTFHLAVLAWVFFRADSVGVAMSILGRIATIPWSSGGWTLSGVTSVGWVAVLLVCEWLGRSRPHPLCLDRYPLMVRWACYYAIVAAILIKAPLRFTPFIYFQF